VGFATHPIYTIMKQVASLRYGVIFKKAFSDPDIFKAFVKDFLGIELNIDKVEMEKSFDPPIGHVDSCFDLFAEDKQNRIIFSTVGDIFRAKQRLFPRSIVSVTPQIYVVRNVLQSLQKN